MRAAHVWVRMDESKNDRVTPPTTPPKATPSPSASTDQPMSLSSPELLKELKQPHTLKHIPKNNGLTKIFSGKGRPIKQNTLCTDSEDLENRAKPAQWQSAGALSLAVCLSELRPAPIPMWACSVFVSCSGYFQGLHLGCFCTRFKNQCNFPRSTTNIWVTLVI